MLRLGRRCSRGEFASSVASERLICRSCGTWKCGDSGRLKPTQGVGTDVAGDERLHASICEQLRGLHARAVGARPVLVRFDRPGVGIHEQEVASPAKGWVECCVKGGTSRCDADGHDASLSASCSRRLDSWSSMASSCRRRLSPSAAYGAGPPAMPPPTNPRPRPNPVPRFHPKPLPRPRAKPRPRPTPHPMPLVIPRGPQSPQPPPVMGPAPAGPVPSRPGMMFLLWRPLESPGTPAAGAPSYAHMHRNARGCLLAPFPQQLYTGAMPRPKKPRSCRRFASFNLFKPAGIPLSQTDVVEIGLDELEAVALCDYEGLHQEQAAEAMDVSRGTVQRLLQTGRRTIADAIVHGKALAIEESEHVHIRPGRGRGRGRGGR